MKKYVVITKSRASGKKDTRLIPAKDKRQAEARCNTETDVVVSCEEFQGQKVAVNNPRPEPVYRFKGLFNRQ